MRSTFRFDNYPRIAHNLEGSRRSKILGIGRAWPEWKKRNASTVNAYASWLRDRGIKYEIRQNSTGEFLLKSEYSKCFD